MTATELKSVGQDKMVASDHPLRRSTDHLPPFSIVVPCFNEVGSIRTIIEQLAVPYTEETSVPVEVTVIDFQDMGEQIKGFSDLDMQAVINYVSRAPVPAEDVAPSVDWINPDFD